MIRHVPRLAAAAFVATAFALAAAPAMAEPQPHMRSALAALRTAEGELARATHDKSGHRVKALADVRAAIRQVEIGIKADNRR